MTTDSNKPFIVFDFDHTLYNGDSGSHLFAWLIKRSPWRIALALLIAPIFGTMIAFLPTRRVGISAFVWVGTVGLHRRKDLDLLIDQYVSSNVETIRERLLPIALDVLHTHLRNNDNVIVATGAPPKLARDILRFVDHENVPVIGTQVGRRFGAITATRHCHSDMKVRMIREAGYLDPIAIAYSDSSADMPLLKAAENPVVVNPKHTSIEKFREELPAGTPILNWGCPDRGGDVVASLEEK